AQVSGVQIVAEAHRPHARAGRGAGEAAGRDGEGALRRAPARGLDAGDPSMHRKALLTALATWASFAASARADQVTVVDVTYEHSAETTHDSHLIVEPLPGTPGNLRSPVDWASGTAYVRLEVLTKPTDVPTRYQVCFNGSPTYACTHQAPPYTTTGVYTWATPFREMWQGERVDWSRGLGDTLSLILKDTSN